MKAVVAAFNQEKALVGAFSVFTNLRMDIFEALLLTETVHQLDHDPADVEVAPHPQRPLHLEVGHEDGQLPAPVPVNLPAARPRPGHRTVAWN